MVFFDNEAVVPVLQVLAFTFVLNTFSFLPNILLTRDLDYKKISYSNICSALVNSIVAVILALTGFKYWSLVFASICMTLAGVLMMNIFRPVRYRFAYDAVAAKNFIKYGGNLFLAGFTVFLIFNADNFIIGAVKGAESLGYYSVAFTWSTMVCGMMTSMVLGVLFPTFSKIQGDKARLKSAYLKILTYVSFAGLLINITLLVVSADFLVVVLGRNTDKWVPALTALRILCIYGIVRLLLEPVGSIMMALNRTDILFKANILAAVIELGCLYPTLTFFGIEGVAVLVTVAYLAQYVIYYRSLKFELQIGVHELGACVGPALLAILPLGLFYLAGEAGFGGSMTIFISKLIGCAGIYLITYGWVTKWGLYKDMRSLILQINMR